MKRVVEAQHLRDEPLTNGERRVHAGGRGVTACQREQHLTSRALRDAFPALGEDVKVMGARRSARFRLTVAAALVDRHLPDADAYREARSRVADEVRSAARGSAWARPRSPSTTPTSASPGK